MREIHNSKVEIEHILFSIDDNQGKFDTVDFEKIIVKVNSELVADLLHKYNRCSDKVLQDIINRFVWEKQGDGLGNVGNYCGNGLGFGRKLWLKFLDFKKEFVKVLKK